MVVDNPQWGQVAAGFQTSFLKGNFIEPLFLVGGTLTGVDYQHDNAAHVFEGRQARPSSGKLRIKELFIEETSYTYDQALTFVQNLSNSSQLPKIQSNVHVSSCLQASFNQLE